MISLYVSIKGYDWIGKCILIICDVIVSKGMCWYPIPKYNHAYHVLKNVCKSSPRLTNISSPFFQIPLKQRSKSIRVESWLDLWYMLTNIGLKINSDTFCVKSSPGKLVKINKLTGKFCLRNELKTCNVFDQVKTKLYVKIHTIQNIILQLTKLTFYILYLQIYFCSAFLAEFLSYLLLTLVFA